MLELGVVIFTVIANLLIAAVVVRKNNRSTTNILLASLSIITAVWTVCNYIALLPGSEIQHLFWVRAVMLFTTPYGSVILLLSHSYPNNTLKMSKRSAIFLLLFNFVTAMFAISPYMFTHVINLAGGSFLPIPGPAILLFGLGFMGFMIIGFIQLFGKYRKSTGLLHKQFQFFLVGLVVSFTLLSLTNFVAVVLFHSILLTSLGPPFTLILFACTVYAIIRHRFLDLNYLIARTISFAILVTVVSSMYALALFESVNILFPKLLADPTSTIFVSTVLALFIAFTLPAIRQFVERYTDRFFYKERFNARRTFDQLADIITSTFNLDALAKRVCELLYKELRIRYIKVVLIQQGVYIHLPCYGIHDKDIVEKDLRLLDNSLPKLILLEELEDGPIKEWMRATEIAAIQTLIVRGETIGYLFLGEKSSGDIFYQEELKTLPTIADQLAVAFENALGVQKISQFNETLKVEIAKATNDLQEANNELKELDKLKDEFVSMASHELKSPMNAIKNYLWLAKTKGQSDPQKMSEYLTIAFNATQRLMELVNDLLDVSRIESGRVDLKIVPLNPTDIVKETVAIFAPQATEKGLSMLNNVNTTDTFLGDDAKVREIVSNFISNAIKYTPKGTVTIETTTDGKELTVHVYDTGIGISASDQTKLFTKFSRVNKSYTQLASIEGTGLGLYICKRFVELMHGTIGLDSTPEKGSHFWFRLPRAT
ncbi:hypothetical protein C5B42_05700 [Candidatus Cerribacteria bacterium 'Amazon FNV 2010 28 9']|uniref:histidine kinase n=1 Tax=Candidatus Cerribacteria bacterium 'Amazon FNV 2010 28 9' TaxID=2081795 RepID=A0A317JML8_9BACT|nr:MAG: hypothetical protein C5B42_05700 [Candidatus Cerribacteria bacterium 'Amazon FNV 2010 28 9']